MLSIPPLNNQCTVPRQKNGAGGIRTPVSVQSIAGVYTCSRFFDLNARTAADSLPLVQSR